ncbi:MAG: hypothetical protein ACAH80_17520 [Alphaproteobacteria bacterium]
MVYKILDKMLGGIDGVGGLVKLFGLALVAAVGLAGAANFPYRDPQGAKETLEKTTELQQITITDSRAWLGGCSRGDVFKTKFNAVNKKGDKIEGIVCSGPFTGSMVRTTKIVPAT